ncbi:MAG: hypothetical protein ACXWV5_02870 [Flavitalea sp.]
MKWGRFVVTIILICLVLFSKSQQIWDGEANDRKWSNPLNWTGDSLPSPGSKIVLNNLYVDSNYSVELDTILGAIVLGSLEITPGANRQIKLLIPTSNKLAPALSFTEPNSLVLNNGSTLINSSGASAGTIIILFDSVYIFNGGRYVHNTPRAHASFVSLISRRAGTERGIFEFDVPNASSTVSMSDRVFGKLVFSSKSAGGASSYTASGTRKVFIRSDLEVIQGARLNLNFTDTISVNGSLLQENSILNVSSGTRNLVVQVSGDLISDSNSSITESGTASGKILLSGNSVQLLDVRGRIQEQVSITINNANGTELVNPLIVETNLDLKKGKLQTGNTNPLVIANTATLVADSLLQDTYIEGPVIFQSQTNRSHTLVPVGRYGLLRWMVLKNWSGEFKAEFIRSDPQLLSAAMNGIHHISSQGYWKIGSLNASTIGGIELSFPDPNFSGVTDLNNLGIAQLLNNEWVGKEITLRKGSPGSNGSVLSGTINLDIENFLTLASFVEGQNPLPINDRRIRIPLRVKPERKVEIKKVIPIGNSLILDIHSGISVGVEFVVYNESGQLIYKQKISVMKGNQNIVIRLPLHSPRIYHIFGLFWGVRTNIVSFKL